ncbi:MAG: AmmeMemoRadiSam system protein B [Planctomycetota bacterium]|jgi:AmmeMemoRadiSam system protein B
MAIRKPIVAGQFYPANRDECLSELKQALAEEPISKPLPGSITAGIVPHAGWMFSGALAGMVFSAVKQQHEKVDTFVLFGAVHSFYGAGAAVYNIGSWLTPLGEIAVDEQLAKAILKNPIAVSDTDAHRPEHSIEVQVPFIQYLFAEAKIVPILVPPDENAIALGQAVGEIINSEKKKVVCIGSTDLTHYGPRYGFTPMGAGRDGLDWAGNVNDQKFIDLAVKLEPEKLLAEAAVSYNACGAGAAAATVAAAKKLGKTEGLLLAHTDSNRIMMRKMGTSSQESVGYAAIVF